MNSDPDKSVRGAKIMGVNGPPWVPSNFLALPEAQSNLDQARVVVLPVPYDGTASFRGGARDGPRAVIEASYNLEDYDPELDADVAEVGIDLSWLTQSGATAHRTSGALATKAKVEST